MKNVIALLAVAGAAAAAQAQVTIVNDRAGTFVDISANGSATQLIAPTITSSFDDCSFSFTSTVTNALFTNTNAVAQTNGWLLFGTITGLNYSNSSIGATGSPLSTNAQALLPFWDDLITYPNSTANPSQGRLTYIQTAGTNLGLSADVGNVLVVQWTRSDLWNTANTNNATFQIQIFQNPIPSGGGYIAAQMLYNATIFNPTAGGAGNANNNGGSATIGYVNGTNGPGFGNNAQWSFNTQSVQAGTVLSVMYAPTPGAASLMGLGALAAIRRRRA